MKPQHWLVWSIGWLASLAMIVGIPAVKGGPDWYPTVFAIAAGYCILGFGAATYLRRAKRQFPARAAWLRAFSAARLGFLVVIAFVVVLAGIGVLGVMAR